MSSSADLERYVLLFKYAEAHCPKFTRQQVISKLVTAADTINDLINIERFRCALLFVDISGFTVLSQELVLEELKSNINAYFKIILDTIHKYNGEVLKFAGDALFVVWRGSDGIVFSFIYYVNYCRYC